MISSLMIASKKTSSYQMLKIVATTISHCNGWIDAHQAFNARCLQGSRPRTGNGSVRVHLFEIRTEWTEGKS